MARPVRPFKPMPLVVVLLVVTLLMLALIWAPASAEMVSVPVARTGVSVRLAVAPSPISVPKADPPIRASRRLNSTFCDA